MKLSVNIALFGCGTVGNSIAERLIRDAATLERRTGVRYELRAIVIRDERKRRSPAIPPHLFTANAQRVLDDPGIDLVIECVGGTADAAGYVERSLARGRHVVTANKDLLATQGPRLHAIAAGRGVTLRFEGAVGGAIPVVRTIAEALAGDEVEAVAGVFNGTCTSILSAMEGGSEYAAALEDAQRRGFAEADPANDVDGVDAAHKLALLVQLAFGLAVISPRIHRRGISGVSRADVERARQIGYRIRLVGAAVRSESGTDAEVAPVLVLDRHAFAQTHGADNVARIVARDAGTLELRGAGAGGPQTASAVLGDVAGALRAIGERHDLAQRGRATAPLPAMRVGALFASLRVHPELPRYRVWSDDLIASREAVAAPSSRTAGSSIPSLTQLHPAKGLSS